jgi:uncharacterized protein (DUF362 family)
VKVFFDTLAHGGYGGCLEKGFEFLQSSVRVGPDTRVCIKPNLTFPTFRQGVMTNPEAVEAVILYLKQFTSHVTICESDSGGYNVFSMTEVFQRTGIADFAVRHGIKVVNMSSAPSRSIAVRAGLRRLQVPLPLLLLDETDLFITMPVPKVHCNTVISLALKNQWGVIQQPSLRLKLHPYFRDVVYAVNKSLPPTLVILDGKYGLTRSGPMRGDVLDLDWFLMSDNIFAADFTVAFMMGLDYRRIPYLRYIFSREGIRSLGQFQFNTAVPRDNRFHMRRVWTDYPGVMTFNSRVLAYLGYESPLAKPLHWLLYLFREPFY